jgi:hypothetical protein
MSSTPGLVPRGPWSDRAEAERVIGPVQQTLQAPATPPLLVAAFLGGLAVLLCLVSGSWGLAVLGVVLGLLACVSLASAWRPPPGDCLLVGERGLAEWRDSGATILLWDDLGITWHVLPAEFDEQAIGDPVAILLEHDNGTRLRLRKVYPGIQVVRKRVSDHLQRNQLARAEAILEGRADPLPELPPVEATPDEPWPAVAPGPWSQREALRDIGPVLLACPPAPAEAVRLRRKANGAFFFSLLVAVLALLSAVLLCVVGYHLGGSGEVCSVAFLLVVAVGSVVSGYLIRKARVQLLESFLVLGERGMASWDPRQVRVVLWDDLGIDWRASSEVSAHDLNEAQLPILLKLQHAEGARFYITELYENAARLVVHVRRELRRAQEAARRALEQRPATLLPEGIQVPAPVTATPRVVPEPEQPETSAPVERDVLAAPHPASWADSDEVRALGAVDFVCRHTWGSIAQTGYGSLFAAVLGLGLVMFACNYLARLIGLPQELFYVVGLGMFLLWLGGVWFLGVIVYRDLSACWLVAADGLAYWDGTQVVTIHWDEIGTVWRVAFLPAQTNPRSANSRRCLVFTSADGTEATVTIDFTDAPKLVARVREEVACRLGDGARMLRPRSDLEER